MSPDLIPCDFFFFFMDPITKSRSTNTGRVFEMAKWRIPREMTIHTSVPKLQTSVMRSVSTETVTTQMTLCSMNKLRFLQILVKNSMDFLSFYFSFSNASPFYSRTLCM